MRGDSGVRLNLLAEVQYRIGTDTVTFRRRPEIGDPLETSLFVEINGEQPVCGQVIPLLMMEHIFCLPRSLE